MSFPIHIHRSFEYFKQHSGATEILIENQKYLLQSGESVLVFPLQPHSYTCVEAGKIQMAIFSPEMVSAFYKANKNKLPTDNRFVCAMGEDVLLDNLFHKKAAAYFICGEFEKGRAYVEKSAKLGDQLLVSLLLYADNNFRTPCLLRDAALSVGYDYAYISKYFKLKVGLSFRQYVNSLRIIESKQLLQETAKSIEEISEESGFASVRHFEREFRAQTGMTPSEYKKTSKQDRL
jgi:YesN/AraC family two-component response regulator